MTDLVCEIFPNLAILLPFILDNEWPTIERIPNIYCPILYVRGLKDTLIPSNHTLNNRAVSVNSKYVDTIELRSGTHNYTFSSILRKSPEIILDYLEKCERI